MSRSDQATRTFLSITREDSYADDGGYYHGVTYEVVLPFGRLTIRPTTLRNFLFTKYGRRYTFDWKTETSYIPGSEGLDVEWAARHGKTTWVVQPDEPEDEHNYWRYDQRYIHGRTAKRDAKNARVPSTAYPVNPL